MEDDGRFAAFRLGLLYILDWSQKGNLLTLLELVEYGLH